MQYIFSTICEKILVSHTGLKSNQKLPLKLGQWFCLIENLSKKKS